MINKIILGICVLNLVACGTPTIQLAPMEIPEYPPEPKQSAPKNQNYSNNSNHSNHYQILIQQAEQQATGKVKDVLSQARIMTLVNQEILKGGCWDYLDTAWTRAGVPRSARKTVYADKLGGKYVSVNELRAGDWIYHVNHGYKGVEHSGLFIGWVDKDKSLGLTLSYAGEQRHEPARYKVYDLSSVYQIIRAE